MAGGSSAGALALVPVAVVFWTLFSGPVDVALLILLTLARHGRVLSEGVGPGFFQATIKLSGSTIVGFLAFQLFRLRWTTVKEPQWNGPGQVLLLPCQTTHSRMFPEKHSFSYSYLTVGVPVGWEGSAGGMLSVDVKSESGFWSWLSLAPRVRKGWYSVDAGDYLERGDAHLGLRGKLDEYLQTQGADPALYPHAYLITAARFLGYHFNPVSFWYLYDSTRCLAAMILEVNNTFGERRMYFLTLDDGPKTQISTGPDSSSADIQQTPASRTTLKQSWTKDFHVSPFNSRKGSYSLTAVDPLSPFMQGTGPVTSTINLASSKGHGKLVARLFSKGSPVDPYAMTVFDKLIFLISWWWVGFVTFPRIVKEAGALFFRRKLHVWFRPEPLKESVGRLADPTERQLESIFRRYLRYLVEQSDTPIVVKYIASGVSEDAKELMLSPTARGDVQNAEELEFKVLTPVFYSRFVYYAHGLEAFFCELNDSCTIWVSRPELLPKFALKKPSPTLTSSSPLDFCYFKMIQRLRVRPERIERPLTSSAVQTEKPLTVDIRDFRISSMDGYVLTHETPETKAAYRRCVLGLFLADRMTRVLILPSEIQRFLLQAWLAWLLSPVVAEVMAISTSFLNAKAWLPRFLIC
ncbi:hypothetical protein B0H66DRAFT_115436 [Apodospora peruviana]|uniref:Uncharacterized protein n=1 Tax=Apodospora peruviana TaxID=516989 RepID=A0AAE0IHX1_9PEZI|nr:hypothetical protein B0H66DRAFT_115436 [Apodospora peruviana]